MTLQILYDKNLLADDKSGTINTDDVVFVGAAFHWLYLPFLLPLSFKWSKFMFNLETARK